MLIRGGEMVSWDALVSFARQLQPDAIRNEVKPEDGARLVRMLLRFHDQLTEPVLRPKIVR